MKKEGVRVRQGQEWCCDCAALGVKAGRLFDKMFVVVHSLKCACTTLSAALPDITRNSVCCPHSSGSFIELFDDIAAAQVWKCWEVH